MSLPSTILDDVRADLHGTETLRIGWQTDAGEVSAEDRRQSIPDVPTEGGCNSFGRFVGYPVA